MPHFDDSWESHISHILPSTPEEPEHAISSTNESTINTNFSHWHYQKCRSVVLLLSTRITHIEECHVLPIILLEHGLSRQYNHCIYYYQQDTCNETRSTSILNATRKTGVSFIITEWQDLWHFMESELCNMNYYKPTWLLYIHELQQADMIVVYLTTNAPEEAEHKLQAQRHIHNKPLV